MLDHMPLRKTDSYTFAYDVVVANLHTHVVNGDQNVIIKKNVNGSITRVNANNHNIGDGSNEDNGNSNNNQSTVFYSNTWRSRCCESLAVTLYYSALCYVLKIKSVQVSR